jgi:hypothetical protein
MNSVYRVDGSTAFASEYAAGPWNPKLQHGGAPAALIAWAVERMETREPMQVVRMTIDLLRPVPIAPLEIKTEVLREGRKIQVCLVTLLHENVAVVRASVLKVRCMELSLPDSAVEEKIVLPGPQQGHVPETSFSGADSFITGLSLRVVQGSFFVEPGPAAIWFRAERTFIAGQSLTPLMRAAMTADFCNGASAVLEFPQWTFINADLTIHLARMPVGEWILLDAQTWLGPQGTGIAFAKLGDERGYFGRAVQSLVIDKHQE